MSSVVSYSASRSVQLSPAEPAEHGGRLTTTAADQHRQNAVLASWRRDSSLPRGLLGRDLLAAWLCLALWEAVVRLYGPAEDAECAAIYTQADGRLTEHALARGDAVVFCSEMVHNVQTLRAGVRESLVIELWTGPPTRVDRYR